MKSILKIYRHYVMTACLLVGFVVFINLAVLAGFYVRAILNEQFPDSWNIRTGGYQSAADALVQEGGGYVMGDAGMEILEGNGCAFSMLLDGKGNVVWEWQKPEELPAQYSAGEIAAFSKWYLYDYPVSVWRYGEEGLLVFAYPKESMVRYNYTWKRNELEANLAYLKVFLLSNAALVFGLALLFGYRFYRSLKPVGEGIDALAQGESVRLVEKGLTQYLREKINQTSALLEKQKKELERRDTARTEWIAGVSHDIRTPLSLIVGYADEIETNEEAAEGVRQNAGIIRTQSLYIKKLIEDLNLTSRLSYHMRPLRRETYIPAVWMRQTAALMLNGKEIPDDCELDLKLDPELEKLHVTGDVQLLTRALQNLLGNCVRHNPQGCHIRLTAQRTEDGFCFCVEDSGAGIPEQVRRILRDEAESCNSEADGVSDRAPHVMGLRVVKQIAAAHGGRLWFEKDGKEVWVSVTDQQGK